MEPEPRRTVAAVPRRATGRQPTTQGWIAIIVFAFMAGLGIIGALASVGLYVALASDLRPPSELTQYQLPEETVIYDRTGKIELARFGSARRDVVTFDEIPPILLDATTAIEDKTFWDNAGFDPVAIASAALGSLRGDARGASTITQQLVRARLLDPALVQDPNRTLERKLKEIIQSVRVTQEFQGVEGKRQIITAYLNQNYYGNQSYGVKAAAESYFGIDLSKIDPAQAAILAGLPKSPSNYDLVRNAVEQCTVSIAEGADCPANKSRLVVPDDSAIVARRNAILGLLASGRTPMSGSTYTAADFAAAQHEPVMLASQATPHWIAPHFVWAVRDELTQKLCGDQPSCEALDAGGLRVITTLDVKLQKIAEKWVRAAAIVPHSKDPTAAAKALGFDKLEPWMANLRSKTLRNGALVAYDYQTGELVAYVGSASYYSTSTRPEFQPQYDVAGKGWRQPGSAFKPFNYVTGIDDHTLTAATMLMDVSTDFGGGYSPNDADLLERGPVRVRNALQFSLNIPAVRAMAVNTPDHVFAKARDFGMTFQTDKTQAGLALALGVQEVHPVDLVTAYGTLANGGRAIGHTTILNIQDRNGKDVVAAYAPPAGTQVVSPQAAFIVTDILSGNTDPKINPFWGKFAVAGPDRRRPATLKTGTNNDAKDLNAYGFIAPPTETDRAGGAYALAVGVWNGNSDNSLVSTAKAPLFSIDVSTYVWQGFVQEASAKWPVEDFAAPADGLTQADIDPWTGLLATSGGPSVKEWFITGTEPKDRLTPGVCGEAILSQVGYESRFSNWMAADKDWLRRAAIGPGTAGGSDRSRTSYFYNGRFQPFGRSWGPLLGGEGCASPSPSPSCIPLPTPDANGVIPSIEIPPPVDSGSAAGSGPPAAVPCPTPSEAPSLPPEASPSAEPSLPPEITPTPAITPTPEITPPPSASPSAADVSPLPS